MVKNRLLEDMPKDDMADKKLKEENLLAYGQTNYIYKNSQNVLYDNTNVVYFKTGELMYKSMLEKLKFAKRYIFIEYNLFDHTPTSFLL